MTTQQNAEVTPEQIWKQIDAEEAGQASPPIESQSQQQQIQNEQPPADQADEPQISPETQQMMDKIAGLEGQLNQALSRLRNTEGHIGGLNNQLKTQLNELNQLKFKGTQAPSADEVRAAQVNPEAMQELERDYPEFAAAMKSALSAQQTEMRKQLEELRSQVQAGGQQQPQGPTQNDLVRMQNELMVEMRHPGWKDRVKTPEFTGWMQRQPREISMLAQSDNPADAVRLLDIHSESLKAVSGNRNRRLDAAAALPSGRASTTVRAKAVEDMTPDEYWRYLDEIDKHKG